MAQKNNKKRPKSRSWRELFRRRSDPHRAYREKYLETLQYQHRTFDVKGLTTQGIFTLELARVFVDLGLGQMGLRPSTDPIPRFAPLQQRERRSIWEYLTAESLQNRNLAVLGAPGSGKTTLLKHLTLTLASPEVLPEQAQGMPQTPILLLLRDYAAIIESEPNFSLLTAVKQELARREEAIPLDWLVQDLQNGRCLIMLDGLDEVAKPQLRRQVVAWVERQMQLYRNNRFIITSRPFGYRNNPLNGVLVLEVRPFTPDQVRQFIRNWYLANEIKSAGHDDKGVRLDARQGAEDLLVRLRQTPVLLDMSVNPLLLTMIATVHRYRSSLPGRRVELYEEICEVFLGKRHEARGILYDLTPAQKKRVLQPLAYAMMHKKQREISIEEAMAIIDEPLSRVSPHTPRNEFLRMIENTSGLLVEREVGMLGFAHLTFQEYLTAVHVLDQRLEHELVRHIDDSWWHEAIRLYAAQADATQVIRACVMRKRPSIQALTLAVECLEEAREVGAEIRHMAERLQQSVAHENPEVRKMGAEVMLQLRLRRMVRLGENRLADTSLVTQAEYQLFLDELRQSGQFHQPDHWREFAYPQDQGREPIAGIRPSDALRFCDWLTGREKGEWQFRLPTTEERQAPDREQKNTKREEGRNGSPETHVGFWFHAQNKVDFNPPPALQEDAAWVSELLTILDNRLANDRMLDSEFGEDDEVFRRIRRLVQGRARNRSFALMDLDRPLRLPAEKAGEIGRLFAQMGNRAAPSQAIALQQALIQAGRQVQKLPAARTDNLDLDNIIVQGQLLGQVIAETPYANIPATAVENILRDLVRARDLTRHQGGAYRTDLVIQRELLRNLGRALSQAQKIAERLVKMNNDARIRLRAFTLKQIINLIHQLNNLPTSGGTQIRQRSLHTLTTYVDLYIDAAILEARIQNQAPPLEGIKLVKEWRALGDA
ncbi:MAG TPA: NACHT domain-containing protein [Anaerolineae bacterium]|nr:NACHT domain-containing protein [Anaerolineae bacterium]